MQKSQSRAIETGHKKQDGFMLVIALHVTGLPIRHVPRSRCFLRHSLGICNVIF